MSSPIDQPERGTGDAAGPRTMPVLLLYYAELEGLKFDHSRLVKECHSRGDTWLISVGETVYGPMPLREAFCMLLHGTPEIALLHEFDSSSPSPEWLTISYNPWWSRPMVALLWTIGVGLVAALLGWIAVCLITPRWLSGPVQVLYWIAAVIAVVLLCLPSEKRRWIKDRLFKRTAREYVVDGAASQSLS